MAVLKLNLRNKYKIIVRMSLEMYIVLKSSSNCQQEAIQGLTESVPYKFTEQMRLYFTHHFLLPDFQALRDLSIIIN